MKITNRKTLLILAVVLLSAFLTWFFFSHETLPKPVRAVTALIETPVAIASAFSHYLNLGIPVYETSWQLISILVFSVLLIFMANQLCIGGKKNNTTDLKCLVTVILKTPNYDESCAKH